MSSVGLLPKVRKYLIAASSWSTNKNGQVQNREPRLKPQRYTRSRLKISGTQDVHNSNLQKSVKIKKYLPLSTVKHSNPHHAYLNIRLKLVPCSEDTPRHIPRFRLHARLCSLPTCPFVHDEVRHQIVCDNRSFAQLLRPPIATSSAVAVSCRIRPRCLAFHSHGHVDYNWEFILLRCSSRLLDVPSSSSRRQSWSSHRQEVWCVRSSIFEPLLCAPWVQHARLLLDNAHE